MKVLRSDLLSTHLSSVAAVSPEHPMLAHTVVYEGSGKLGLELAIYPLQPLRGNFEHFDFLKLHYIRHKLKDVSFLRVAALTCNITLYTLTPPPPK